MSTLQGLFSLETSKTGPGTGAWCLVRSVAAAKSIFLELLAVTPPPPFFFSFGPAGTWCHLSYDKSSCSLE